MAPMQPLHALLWLACRSTGFLILDNLQDRTVLMNCEESLVDSQSEVGVFLSTCVKQASQIETLTTPRRFKGDGYYPAHYG